MKITDDIEIAAVHEIGHFLGLLYVSLFLNKHIKLEKYIKTRLKSVNFYRNGKPNEKQVMGQIKHHEGKLVHILAAAGPIGQASYYSEKLLFVVFNKHTIDDLEDLLEKYCGGRDDIKQIRTWCDNNSKEEMIEIYNDLIYFFSMRSTKKLQEILSRELTAKNNLDSRAIIKILKRNEKLVKRIKLFYRLDKKIKKILFN